MPTSASATGFTPQDSNWKNWIQKPMKISCMTEPCSAFTRQSGMIQKDGEGKSSFMKKIQRSLAPEEFPTAMGALDIRPVLRGRSFRPSDRSAGKKKRERHRYPGGHRWTGSHRELCTGVFVPAGTPVCEESGRFSGDRSGLQTGVMKAFVTVRDGLVSRPGNHSENDRGRQSGKWF